MTSPRHIDVAAYALDVLDTDEVKAFEQHLAHCTSCQAELREFTGVRRLLDQAPRRDLLNRTQSATG